MGKIPKVKGLYRIVSKTVGDANAIVERITLDEFHHRMGHISCKAARDLARHAEGVELTDLDNKKQCKSCIFAKATKKSVPKQRQGERAEVFGKQVHSDVW
ncbi:hypothetical protein BT96DRAFT_842429, partial [Gymnopus androsaceus JB14]